MSDSSNTRCVLLIDDNEVDNMINNRLIEKQGLASHVYTFTSGKGGLEFLKNIDKMDDFPPEFTPDIVFLDINMPIMNGFSFIKSLDKLSDRVTEGMRIVLLTQSDSPQDIKEARKFEKVIEYVVKPLNAEKLKALNF